MLIKLVTSEATVQSKIERDRISNSVNAITKILHVKDEDDIKAL